VLYKSKAIIKGSQLYILGHVYWVHVLNTTQPSLALTNINYKNHQKWILLQNFF